VREIIAKRIIKAAQNGERDPDRLYEQALIVFGIVVSVGDPPCPCLRRGHAPSVIKSPVLPGAGLSSYFARTGGDLFRFKLISDVPYWHEADMGECTARVRFRGEKQT